MQQLPIPIPLLVMDVVGTLLAGVGLAGLLTDLSGIFPLLADRDAAGMIAGVGFALMTYAILQIVRILRARRQYAAQAQAASREPQP